MFAKTFISRSLFLGVFVLIGFIPKNLNAQGHWDPAQFPAYLGDRGSGSPTSMFGTYIRKGELIVYPFFEYYYDNKSDNKLEELGYGLNEEFKGKFTGNEYLIFLGYGITDRLVLEIEAALMSAKQKKSSDDPSEMPDTFTETGLGDVQTQLDYYWLRESERRVGAFSYLEIVYPFSKDRKMIGTQEYEFKFGNGIIKGFSWGTLTLRAAVEYAQGDDTIELGEVALEYLKRVNKTWRLYLGVEGSGSEWELITEAQIHFTDWMFFKFNNAFGVTSGADNWAPEVGFMFSIH